MAKKKKEPTNERLTGNLITQDRKGNILKQKFRPSVSDAEYNYKNNIQKSTERLQVGKNKFKTVTSTVSKNVLREKNADGYLDTKRKYGDYSKSDASKSNYKVYQKGNKFYYYDEKNKKYEKMASKNAKTKYVFDKNDNKQTQTLLGKDKNALANNKPQFGKEKKTYSTVDYSSQVKRDMAKDDAEQEKKWLNSLSKEDRKAYEESAKYSNKVQKSKFKKSEKELIEKKNKLQFEARKEGLNKFKNQKEMPSLLKATDYVKENKEKEEKYLKDNKVSVKGTNNAISPTDLNPTNVNYKSGEIGVQLQPERLKEAQERNELARTQFEENQWVERNKKTTNLDKITQPFTSAASQLVQGLDTATDFGNRVYIDEEGKEQYLPSKSDLQWQRTLDSYNTKVGKFLAETTNNVGKILATQAMNIAVPGSGTAVYWTSMFGNNYQNAFSQSGGDSTKASLNAIANTGLEFLTAKTLGSATKGLTGGKASQLETALSNLTYKISKNPAISSYLGKGGSEFTEEFIQEYLGNAVDILTLGSDGTHDNIKEMLTDPDVLASALYSGLMGAVSSAGIAGTTNISTRATGGMTEAQSIKMAQTFKEDLESTIEEYKKNPEENKKKIKKLEKVLKEVEKTSKTPFTENTVKSNMDTVDNIDKKITSTYSDEQQAQMQEINADVLQGKIDHIEANNRIRQMQNGTYAENRKIETQNDNLDTIAIQQREQLDRQLEQGLITDEQYNQELRDIANATKQTREQINTPQNQVETQPQTNETTQDNAITQETQNMAQNEQNYEGLNQKEYNEIQKRYKNLIETTGFEEDFIENAKPSDIVSQLKSIKELYEGDEGFLYEAKNWESPEVYKNTKSQYDKINRLINRFEGKINQQQNVVQNKQNNKQENRINDHTLEYNGYYIMSEKPNVGYEYKSLEESPRFQIYDANNDDITHNVANWVGSIDEAKSYIDSIKNSKVDNNVETNETVEQQNNEAQQEQVKQEERKQPEILDKMPTEKKSTIKSLKKGIGTFRKEITDAFAPVYDMARKTRNMTLYHKADKILGSDGMAQVDLGRNQVDLKGKPFKNFTDENGNKVSMSWEKAYDSYNKIPNKAKNEFLVHQLNIDRLNQGVDQFEGITLQESQQRVEELRKQYKDIDKWSENTYQFYRNLIQNMVDNGRMPQSLADKWLKETPHFIHIERQVPNKGNQGVSVKNGKVDSDNLIRKIKGGNYAILPIKETTANYVQNARRAFAFNDFGKEYARTIGTDARGENVSADTDIDEIFGFEPEFVNSDGSGNYTLKIYENGTPVEIPISEDVYNSLSPKTIPRVGVLAEATKIYKDLLTNKNPFFGFLRNPIKDVGDMFLYSKHPLYKSIKTYTKLFGGRTALRNRKITKDGVTAQDIVDFYHNTGNAVHSFYKNGQFESNKGNTKKGVDKVLSPIEKGNDFMESMPRITEFWNTIESEGYTIKDGELVPQKGKTPKKKVEQVIAEASYNAADVTVNFKRGGRTSKAISQNGGIFFNPSVQGASKFTRNITEAVGDAKAGDFQAAKRLILRAAGMGVAPAILSAIMYGDDDEYKEIQDYQKDQYYLIKAGDGKWIRIPKGRALSLFESATRRALDKGKGGKFGAKEYGKLALNQIAPSNPLDNNIFSPITSAITNKSWSGNKIVSDSMAKRPVEEQFNEKTDELSKKLGKQLGISPMKINYVINQYSGVLGDLVLPQITPKASTGSSNPIMNILRDNYSFDAANSSKNVGDFYDVKGKLNTKASGLNPSSKDKLESQYMNKQAQKMYALYDKKQKIQMDKNLSKKEKYQQALEVQKEINKFAKKATENVKKVDIKKNTATIGNDLYYKNKNSNSGWSQENEKTTQKREALGLSPEKYYYYKNDESYKTSDGYTKSITSGKNAKQTIAMVEAFNFDPSDYLEYKSKLSKIRGDKGANGKTIRYSARKKKIAYLNTLPISSVEKAYLMKQSDRYYKSSDNSLKKAIKSSSMSEEDKKQIYSYLRLGR